MHVDAFFKVCLVLIFLNTIVEKTYLEITILNQIHDRKALFEVPKICNINFWIENDPPLPLWHFSKNSSDLVAAPFPYDHKHLRHHGL